MLKKEDLVIVSQNSTILEVLESMNSAGMQIAILTDENERLAGIVTDGDIRRGFISGSSNRDLISSIMNKNPEIALDTDETEFVSNKLNHKFQHIPILNKEKKIMGLFSNEEKNVYSDLQGNKVCVLGLGHVGLTLSLVMAEMDFNVFGFDVNDQTIEKVKNKESSFHEKDLQMFLNRYVGERLIPTTNLKEVDADIYIITVGTPINEETKLPRIDYIEKAASDIGSKLKKNDIVILRSTVPVGTTRNVVRPILDKQSGLKCGSDYFLAYAPERTIEGDAISEIKELPQIIGGYDTKSRFIAEQIFKRLTGVIIDVGSLESAEMVKIMNNTFRDVKFGYANEMALLCKDLGLDMTQLVNYANLGYKRDKIPVPSPGVGGACLSKDSYILSYSARDSKYKTNIVSIARETNESIPKDIVREIKSELESVGKKIGDSKIFIIGFAFKGDPETSDIRGSTTLDLLEEFSDQGADMQNIFGADPIVAEKNIDALGIKVSDYNAGFKEADAVVLMNNHKSYKTLDIFSLLESSSEECIFFDGWHMFDPSDINSINKVTYLGVGCKF
tara:strand:- start:293 stop:1975 length:1683 start_codon:yes stop_codon:yes gene_type:complete